MIKCLVIYFIGAVASALLEIGSSKIDEDYDYIIVNPYRVLLAFIISWFGVLLVLFFTTLNYFKQTERTKK